MGDLGKILYAAYVETLAQRDCSIESWNELSDEDKQDWRKTADRFIEVMDF